MADLANNTPTTPPPSTGHADASNADGEVFEVSKNAQGLQTIKVSTVKNVFFYVDLTTKFLRDNEQLELSGLGFAIGTVVTVAEILKTQKVATIKKINTSMTNIRERRSQKPKIEILLQRAPNFKEIFDQKQIVAEENKKLKEETQAAQQKFQDTLKTQQ